MVGSVSFLLNHVGMGYSTQMSGMVTCHPWTIWQLRQIKDGCHEPRSN